MKEVGRELTIDPETEAKLLAVAKQPMKDVLIVIQDTGMRPEEVFRIRIEHIAWSITNKIYVANQVSNNVTVIDGVTNKATTVTDPNAKTPFASAVNPVTNEIYVANNSNPGTVTVIDGLTNTPASITVGTNPEALAVNPVTNKIYVANAISNNVTVIDGATKTTATLQIQKRTLRFLWL